MDAATQPNPARLLFRDREQFRSLHSGETASFGVIAGLYATAVAALVLVWLASRSSLAVAVPIFMIAFLVIGWAQYSIGNGMHEAVHQNLCNRRGDWLAWAITCYPIGLFNDRDEHLAHHKYLGTSDDPAYPEYSSFPNSKTALLARLLWFGSGLPAFKQFLQQQGRAQASARPYLDVATLVAVQLVLVSLFWLAFGNVLYYIVFWVLPVATIGKLFSTTRLLCEHGSPDRDWVVRTIDGHRWQTWLMGAFDFNFHGEHHLFPSVPYAQLQHLRDLHRSYLSSHPEYRPFDGRFEVFDGGYLALLAHWFRVLPWRAA
jgi:fatty acid desaturase